MQPSVPEPVFINVEYFFFLVYRVFARIVNFVASDRFLVMLNIIATIVVIALITGIIFILVRLYEMKKEDDAKKKTSAVATPSAQEGELVSQATSKRNDTWLHIRERLLSDVQSDWRLAIIEADIYLDRLLDARGYHGETFSDKLKQISPDQLGSIQVIWEAHKVRNRIAHEGSAFTLTQPEARRVLSYYEIAFRDLEVIE